MDKKEISVALCTYNGERFIARQLESILEQTLQPREIVICDDNSSDATCEIIEAFMDRYPRKIKLYKNPERMGRNRNFSQAIGLCASELIALSDQDDVFAEDKFEKLVNLLERDSRRGLVFSNAAVVDENFKVLSNDLFSIIWPPFNQRRKRLLKEGRIYQVLARNSPAIGCSMVFRSDLRRYILPIPEEYPHDFWIMAITGLFADIGFTEERLVFYRQHGQNIAGVQSGLLRKMMTRLTANAQDYYDEVKHGLDCWKLLEERIESFERDPDKIEERYEEALRIVKKKLFYFKERLDIASRDTNIVKRASRIAKLSCRNYYYRYGRGSYDFLRDLLVTGLRSRDLLKDQLRKSAG